MIYLCPALIVTRLDSSPFILTCLNCSAECYRYNGSVGFLPWVGGLILWLLRGGSFGCLSYTKVFSAGHVILAHIYFSYAAWWLHWMVFSGYISFVL